MDGGFTISTALIIAIVAFTLLLFVIIGVRVWLKRRHAYELLRKGLQDASVRYAFIVNPSKPHAGEIIQKIRAYCATHNIENPMFIETLLDKDGHACALEALERGADVVVAVGGDGTVRTVASALADTGHVMGIIPIGTGNLFARNMQIPIDDIDLALHVATSHGSRRVDIGRMQLLDSPYPHERHAFLIIAGIGFDALMIDGTSPTLKKSLGWLAYFVGGMKNLLTKKLHGTIRVRFPDGTQRSVQDVNFQTFMAGNCGKIPGFSLMPEAAWDDGILDFELIDTTGGLLGWTNLFGDVVHQTITGRSGKSPLSTNSTIEQMRGMEAEIMLDRTTFAQVDGDVLGETRHIIMSVDRRALLVRVPEPTLLAPSNSNIDNRADTLTQHEIAHVFQKHYGNSALPKNQLEHSNNHGDYGLQTLVSLTADHHATITSDSAEGEQQSHLPLNGGYDPLETAQMAELILYAQQGKKRSQ